MAPAVVRGGTGGVGVTVGKAWAMVGVIVGETEVIVGI
jgi:hypothetical protein